ncbi:uncharacterized protein LOC135472195 [Liolophura sinensis]|uniref:uncharacterized protein LOC135472195 n=1 Tax=Liolophura sinensis TaxID=3198878 RepID=UPI003159662A
MTLENPPQLGALEMGLRDLRCSQLMEVPEFQNMYDAIKHHHKEQKLSRLTGNVRNKINQGQSDTKFYLILAKMLYEVSQSPGNSQENNLNMVYNWYKVNKSQIKSGPKFGKGAEKLNSNSSRRSKTKATPIRLSYAHQAPAHDGSHCSGSSEIDVNWTLSRSPSPDWDLASYSHTSDEENFELNHDIVDQYTTRSGSTFESHTLSSVPTVRPPHNTISSAGRLKGGNPRKKKSASSVFSSNIKHPISSLVNPHAAVSIASASGSEDPVSSTAHSRKSESSGVPLRPITVADMRSARMDTFKEFQHELLQGQDTIGNMTLLGRSGTPYDLRYVAHDHGERPELETEQVISAVNGMADKQKPLLKGDQTESQAVINQSLTDFCQTTDNYYPYKQRKYSAVPKSAPSRDQTPLGTPAGVKLESPMNMTTGESTSQPSVKLDVIMNVIDDVTTKMTRFREKLGPVPQPGFRPPARPTPPLPKAPARTCTIHIPTQDAPFAASRTRPATFHTRPQTAQPRSSSLSLSTNYRPSSCVRRSPEKSPPGRHPSPERPRTAHYGIEQEKRRQLPVPPGMTQKNTVLPPSAQNIAQALDWRGKVSPDVISNKWVRSGMGGHTYVKSLKNKKRSESASKRPKTAPAQVSLLKEKSQPPVLCASNQVVHVSPGSHPVIRGSIQHSQGNPLASQSIPHSNRPQQLDQEDVDQMMVIRYLGGTSEENPPGWFEYNSELLSRLSQGEARVSSVPKLQFLSLITPRSALGLGTRTHRERTELTDENDSLLGQVEGPGECDGELSTGDSNQPCESENEDGGQETLRHEELKEDFDSVEAEHDSCDDGQSSVGDSEPEVGDCRREESGRGSPATINPINQTQTGDVLLESNTQHLSEHLTYPVADFQAPPTQCKSKRAFLRQLELNSQVVSLPLKNSRQDQSTRPATEDKKIRKRHMTGRASLSVRPADGDSRRSGGRSLVSLSSSTGVQGLTLTGKRSEDLTMPSRTAPSIPSSHSLHQQFGVRPVHGAQAYMSELEHHAHKMSTPLKFVEKVSQLRFGADEDNSTQGTEPAEDLCSGMLTVCRLPLPARPVKPDSDASSELQYDTCGNAREPSEEESEMSVKHIPKSRHLRREKVLGTTMLQSKLAELSHPDYHTPVPGRPIPTVLEVYKPDEVAARVKRQKEVKAAVDIQRIFRGYIARNFYDGLKKEERERRENERASAIAIQKALRRHLHKVKAIYNRPTIDPELQIWAKGYNTIKKITEVERQAKRQQQEKEIAQKQHETSAKLSVIGPHVNIYDIYHPKKVGPSKALINQAALVIQKYARGMLVRNKLASLKRKALYHGSDWKRYVQEYKKLLRRVQERHGVLRPVMPFTYSQLDEYMDIRRRYEMMFERKAFGGEIEVCDLPKFFKECDLYPSQLEMDDAVDVVIRGQDKGSRGLYKKEVMEVLYHIYPPAATNLSQYRKSTWMNPIIDGEEAKKLLGSPCVEDTPLSVCVKLVVDSRRERRQREEAERQRQREQEVTIAAAEPYVESAAEPQDTPDITHQSPVPQEDQKGKKVVFVVPDEETLNGDS